MHRSGFSLIEVLVVVVVIGILLSILLPSLGAARESSRAVVCASNLKQIGNGWHSYADLQNEVIVPGRPGKYSDSDNVYWVGNGYQYRPRWFVQMGAAAGFYAYDEPSRDPAEDNTKTVDNPVFVCPTRAGWINNRNYTYGYNFQFLGNSRFLGDDPSAGFINYPVKRFDLSHASATVLVADTLGTAATHLPQARSPYRVDGSALLKALGNHGWSLDPPRLTATGDFCDNKHRNEARSGPDPRHAERTNFLYGDTHVEKQEPEEVGYRRKPNGAYAMPGEPENDDQSHNHRFSGTGADLDPPPVN